MSLRKKTVPPNQEDLRKRSGNVDNDDPLVSFLYDLMRDYLTPGQVESILDNVRPHENVQFCNGYLASYAKDVAERLRAMDRLRKPAATETPVRGTTCTAGPQPKTRKPVDLSQPTPEDMRLNLDNLLCSPQVICSLVRRLKRAEAERNEFLRLARKVYSGTEAEAAQALQDLHEHCLGNGCLDVPVPVQQRILDRNKQLEQAIRFIREVLAGV